MFNIGLISSQTPFIPSLLSGGVFWLESSDTSPANINSSSGSVSGWTDKFGNGNDAIQLSGGDQPQTGLNTINGKNVITFQGDPQYLEIPYDASIDFRYAGTFFIVFRNTLTNLNTRVFCRINNQDNPSITFNSLSSGSVSFGIQQNISSPTNSSNVDFGTTTANTPTISAMGFELQTQDTILGKNNNNAIVSADASGTAETIRDMGVIRIGAQKTSTTNRFLIGDIGEFIAYDRLLSTSEINAIVSYLNNKWSVF